jgi:PKHD-type hydroxylase|tara:strand:+ start:479 stop:1072 length:594 start_codon:yes stop_codon:yes gene_type:complete
MLLEHNYYFFKKAVPIKTCEKILKAGRKKIAQRASTAGRGLDLSKRNCMVAWINDKWIYEIINPFIHTANKQAGWNFECDWNESSQFTIYEKGHYYGWHADQKPEPNKNKDKNLDGKIRKLSLTLQLTDKTEYEGGDFQFMWIRDDTKGFLNVITIDDARDIGTVIIFPSFIYHQVLPITKGKRETLVNWSLGNEFC